MRGGWASFKHKIENVLCSVPSLMIFLTFILIDRTLRIICSLFCKSKTEIQSSIDHIIYFNLYIKLRIILKTGNREDESPNSNFT